MWAYTLYDANILKIILVMNLSISMTNLIVINHDIIVILDQKES